AFAAALAAIDLTGVEIVVGSDAPDGIRATSFADLVATKPTAAVEAAFGKVGPETVAKILYTSGSTGMPKGVVNTQRMMAANVMMAVQTWPFVRERPLVLLDWLPWNHTFGGNHNFNLTLQIGGSLYI